MRRTAALLPLLVEALAALAALAAPRPCLAARVLQQQRDGAPDWDVIVVGAGMAGVTAAADLRSAGWRVLVLEARDRAGGRLDAIAVPGGTIDRGAMWIHGGGPGNALYDLTQSLGLPLSPQQNYASRASYTADGARSSPRTTAETFAAFQGLLVSRINRMRATLDTPDQPLADVYRDFLKRANLTTPSQLGQANLMMHTYYQALLNANVTALSTLRLGDAKSIPAIDVVLRDGFPAVVEALKQGLDIRYRQAVTSIQQEADQVTVATAGGGTHSASYALTTVPLGLLKSNAIMFSPPLPDDKAAAIAAMGYGLLDKAILVFNETFWDGADFLLREMPDWSGRWAITLNYHKLFPGVKALVAIHVADTARALQALTDAEVVGQGMAALRQVYGPGIPDPIQWDVTRWAADPFSRGSYSYFAAGNPRNITATIGAPAGRLLFAGEATSDHPATVLGAYLSGLREAERAARLLAASLPGAAAPQPEAAL